MTGKRVSSRSGVGRKILAIAAAAVVLASGATVTSLAATGWSDEEWVNGGVAGVPGVTASTFNVQQNVVAAPNTAGWSDHPATPGNSMSFSSPTTGLVPGETVYAFVRLRTVVKSLGGTLQLTAATMDTGGSAPLFSALRYRAKLMNGDTGCTSANFAATGSYLVGDATTEQPLATAAGSTFTLAAGTTTLPGAEQTVCFAMTLPHPQSGTALQGASTTPVWQFTADSI